ILTVRQKWNKWLKTECSYLTKDYLSEKFPGPKNNESLFINGSICPNAQLVKAVKTLKPDHKLIKGETLIAYNGKSSSLASMTATTFTGDLLQVNNVWDIFQKNGDAIREDFELLTKKRKSAPLGKSVTVIGKKNLIFLEKGAKAQACILNTSSGPIYLDKDSEIMEGSAVRGPFSLGEHSALKLNTKIYGPTTIGPQSKVGGEVSNSVIFGFTNKAHDGFLGNSVLGEWCNLGADTNNSNLKNNYASVKLFNYRADKLVDTGLQFCGLIMGDHSKSGINTMFNTGTVVGVGANIFGGGFPATHIPSFSWGGSEGFETYKQEKLFETAERVFERRGLSFSTEEKNILDRIFNQTKKYRKD
ncbi:MAG: glucose-phosphate thymidylyltransferase, partial [Bacteroidetes bacterium]|nr:glucose-phosphate thymidylyltransferase [Bacteroidota bacterium]